MLQGLKILDLTCVLSGPLATSWLSDMGASVVKVENPDGGDATRLNAPFVNEASAYYATFNRNKRCVTLNLKDPKGNKYTVSHIDEIRVGSDLTRVLLTSDTAQLIYGKKMEATNFNTGRVYPDCLVVQANCVYSYNGQDYYIRLVDKDGVVLGEAQVEIGFSMNGFICITDGAEEGQFCDSGYKAIAEG